MTPEVREPGVYPLFPPDLDWVEHEDQIDWEVVPEILGPVWDKDPTYAGPRDPDGYILPYFTLGYQAIKWGTEHLLADEMDEFDKRLPFRPTPEQARFILWFYAIDERGRFLHQEIVLQRLKGHGKDPLASFIAAIEFIGPCRFAGWASKPRPDDGLVRGDPVARPHPRAWVQVAAVTIAQTQNTMSLFRGLFTEEAKEKYGINIGNEVIYALGGQKKIEAVTSNPKALEGNRPTLVIANEPHQWGVANKGIAMYDAVERNATKAKGGAARVFAITNAYHPSEESVGRNLREGFEQIGASGWAQKMLYDTLEAPVSARLRPAFPDELPDAPDDVSQIPEEVKERLTRRYLGRVLKAVVGDAWWLEIESLVNSILNPKNKPSRSRRFWFNQVWAAEDAWVDPAAVAKAIDQDAMTLRQLAGKDSKLRLEAGWMQVQSTDPIVMFFDGSKSDDWTAIVGCRVSDGYTFLIGAWGPPKQDREKRWRAPRAAVTARVSEAFERFNVIAYWGDPSHTKTDDEDERETSYWMPTLDQWMRDYRDRLPAAYWPVKSGLRTHAISWDMTSSDRTKLFIAAAEQVVDEFENRNDIEEYDPLFRFDGHPVLVQHLNNAIQHPDPRGWGTSLSKDKRESPRKIDAAVCLVGARMLRRMVLNAPPDEEEKPGEIW